MRTFKLSDESVNSYGFSVSTSGIDTSYFSENPVMLYEHDSLNVIGKWVNLRKEGGALYAEAQFDEEDDLAKKVKGKVERGYLKGVSIGMHIDAKSVKNNAQDVPVAEKTRLFEASICAVPANGNALRLCDNNKTELTDNEKNIFLSKINKEKMEEKNIMLLLSALSATAFGDGMTRIDDLLAKEKELTNLKAEIKQQRDAEIAAFLSDATKSGKIKNEEIPTYKDLAENDFLLCKNVLSKLMATPKMIDIPHASESKNNNISFNEWRKKDPAGLLKYKAENPEEYSEMLKKEGILN